MQGDRERCLAAGMDGYLSKPIDVDELIATVERFGAARHVAARRAHGRTPDDDSVFDERAALAYTGGDRRLLKQVVRMFRADYPSSLRRIERALRRRDAEALRHGGARAEGRDRDRGVARRAGEAAAELERPAARSDSRRPSARTVHGCAMSSTARGRPFAAAGSGRAARHDGRPLARKRRSPQRKRRRS